MFYVNLLAKARGRIADHERGNAVALSVRPRQLLVSRNILDRLCKNAQIKGLHTPTPDTPRFARLSENSIPTAVRRGMHPDAGIRQYVLTTARAHPVSDRALRSHQRIAAN